MHIERNREIKKYFYGSVESIDLFLAKIERDYKVRLQYHDISGVMLNDYRLGPVLMKYYSHSNDFCNYVKKNKKCGFDCYILKSKISECARRVGRPFYGVCHMGFEEYIFPVVSNGHYIGYFTVGEFYTDREKKENELRKSAQKWGFDEDTIIELYFKTAKKIDFDVETMAIDVNTVANFISMYVGQCVETRDNVITEIKNKTDDDENQSEKEKDKNFVVDKIKEYIIENYCNDVSLDDLADICHCNKSYLSYVFKKKTGQSITEYINSFRVNKAKYLLFISNLTITQVSYNVGYNDSGYFSRVFKKNTGMSPEKFRKNMKR